MLVVLGIPNCDSVKKARTWLEEQKIDFEFRDLRKQELNKKEWENLVSQDTENLLINTKGPSFRKLGVDKSELSTKKKKLEVLLEMPTAMKRPVIIKNGKIKSIGFQLEKYEEIYL